MWRRLSWSRSRPTWGWSCPEPEFLPGLRKLCNHYGSLLIFDEVITGFRLARGGAQELFGVLPDLTCLGKIIGGGLPVGAYGGKRDIMMRMAPVGDVYQAGTLSGNPLAMSAGLATLEMLDQDGFYEALEEKADYLAKGLEEAAKAVGVEVVLNRIGSLGCGFFTREPGQRFRRCAEVRYSGVCCLLPGDACTGHLSCSLAV